MAIVVRFNTLILRKSWLQEQFPGGLTAYPARYLPQHANFYIEDDRLVAHQSMVDLAREVELLRSAGMDLADNASTIDWCLTHQEDTRLRESCGPEVQVVNGLFVCWCRGEPSWFICDVKSRRFVAKVAEMLRENCRTVLGLEAAARAVDLVEYQNGPLSGPASIRVLMWIITVCIASHAVAMGSSLTMVVRLDADHEGTDAVLPDDAAIFECMVYVDLNPIRTVLLATPEKIDATSE